MTNVTDRKVHDCPWTSWRVTTVKTYKEVGTNLLHPKKILIRSWCSYAPRCKQRCLYNGKSRTSSPFPEDAPKL